ncbi:MAG: HAD family hydrolase [Actinomycetota bacterium]
MLDDSSTQRGSVQGQAPVHHPRLNLAALFLDFDGVILESVEVKTDAFRELFADHPLCITEAVVQYHVANLGLSRYEKFRWVYEHLLDQELTEATMAELCQRFEQLVVARVLRSPLVPGADAFLQAYSSSAPCFVVSATPQAEIEYIVSTLGLDVYFKSVHGSPTPKGTWISHLLDLHDLDPGRCVMVGDALSDWRAATENGVHFVARIATEGASPLHGTPCLGVITDLHGLPSAVSQI